MKFTRACTSSVSCAVGMSSSPTIRGWAPGLPSDMCLVLKRVGPLIFIGFRAGEEALYHRVAALLMEELAGTVSGLCFCSVAAHEKDMEGL